MAQEFGKCDVVQNRMAQEFGKFGRGIYAVWQAQNRMAQEFGKFGRGIYIGLPNWLVGNKELTG